MMGLIACPYALPDDAQEAIRAELRTKCGPGDMLVLAREDCVREMQNTGVSLQGWAETVPRRYDVIIVVPNEEDLVGIPTAKMIERALDYGRRVVLYRPGPDLLNFQLTDGPNGRYRRVVAIQ